MKRKLTVLVGFSIGFGKCSSLLGIVHFDVHGHTRDWLLSFDGDSFDARAVRTDQQLQRPRTLASFSEQVCAQRPIRLQTPP